jgi:hypothetical protein
MTMNEEMECKIQALIDGELSAPARKDLLLDLEKHYPEHWRTLALGFVEAQLLGEALIARQNSHTFRAFFPNILRIAAILAVGAFLGVLFSQQLQPPPSLDSVAVQPTTPLLPPEDVVEITQSRIDRISDAVSEHGFNPVIERTLIEADLGEGRRLVIPLNRLLIASTD